jgi:phosphohistidine phosphatase SixA
MIPIEVLDELDADGDTPSALAAIDFAAQGRAHIVAVGHQPMIGLLIERLTGASPSVSPGSCHSMVFDREFGFGVGRLLGAEERTT